MSVDTKKLIILVAVFVVSACSLTYELLIGTAAAYLSGSSVQAFSFSIGIFLSGLGFGAFLSRYIKQKDLTDWFVAIETSIALIGGISVIAMFFSFVYTKYHFLVQILFTLAVGTISGLEIPVLSRLLNLSEKFWLSLSGKNVNTVSQEKEGDLLKNLISNVLSFDYLGGLAASLLFSSILLPWLGLVRLNFLTGILNLVMALICMLIFWKRLKQGPLQLLVWFFASVVLISGAVFSKEIYDFSESRLYSDQIIYSEQTPYQRVVVTKRANDLRLYLNGGVQFSTLDEYRYHESLVVPGFLQLLSNQEVQEDSLQVVFFGGGDGLAVREALKFEKYIKKIQVVDIDPAVTNLAKSELFAAYNHSSLLHEKVEVINQDVWLWIQEQSPQNFDLIVSDLPDPQEEVIARLYTKEFYKFCRLSMKEGAVFISQSSGIYNTPKVFWSVHKTLQEVFFEVVPYKTYIPSFGLWGFNLAINNQKESNKFFLDTNFEESLSQGEFQYLNSETLTNNFILEKDLTKDSSRHQINYQELKVNDLDSLVLPSYYQEYANTII